MKKFVQITIICFLACNLAFGEEVPLDRAIKVAKNFLTINHDKSMDTLIHEETVYDKGNALCYYLNLPDDGGYIVIAAYDQVAPVLAYSFAHAYDDKYEKPPQFIWWMNNYYDQIKYVIEHGLQADDDITNQWMLYLDEQNKGFDSGAKYVNPLLTTTWGQGCYYNGMCPEDASGPCGRTLAGSVAIAMAQIMKYHNWPATGNGTHSYNHPDYGWLSANFGATTYNWIDMPNSLSATNSSTAKLIYHCGVSVEMDYGTSNSIALSADAPNAYINHFRYDAGCSYHLKGDYSDTQWHNMMRGNLNIRLPIHYRGAGTGVHAWVVDGYQGDNHFHMNWGWYGNYNGYFYLTSLTPGPYNFTNHQAAILDIKPASVGPCTQIVSLGTGGPGNALTYASEGTGLWLTDACGFTCNGKERIYSFVAPHDGVYSLQVTSTNGHWVDYFWKPGSCSQSGWSCIGWFNLPATQGSMNWTEGITYYILADAECFSFTMQTFHINVPPEPGTWTGIVNTDWHMSGNWSGNIIPDGSIDVTIPSGTPHSPNVSAAAAHCKDLTVNTGASLNIGAKALNAQGNVNIHGTLNLNHTSGSLRTYADLNWQSGSTANVTGSATIFVQGIWDFRAGSNVQLTSGFVDFFGSGKSWIRSRSGESHFNHVRNNKTGEELGLSNLSTQACRLVGNLFIYNNCKLTSSSSQNIIIGNYVNNNNGMIELTNGTFVFGGASGSSSFMSGDFFNNVIIFSTATTTFNNDVEIKGNLLIQSGALSPGSNTLTIGGNWTNNAGAGGFIPGSSTIIFESGGDHQDVNGTNTFNNVTQLNAGYYLRFFGPTTIQNNLALNYLCWAYQNMNISGMLDLSNVGSKFTANTANANVTIAILNQGGKLMANGGGSIYVANLVQNYVGGIVEAGTGSLIDITNSGLEPWVDLKGSIYNSGGTINLSGTYCYWPYANGAHLEMTDGIIDIKTCALVIDDLYSWTHSITGGTIRTSKSFSGNRADFTPTAGTFEFYGSGDHLISQSNGCTLFDVVINKSSKEGGENISSEAVYDKRSGKLLSGGGKANTISLESDFTITGNLDIDAGTLSIGQYAFNIFGNTNISGNLDMTHDLSVINAQGDVFWNSGSTANFTAENVFIAWGHWNFENGSNANFADGTILFKGNTSKYIRSHSQTSSFNNVEIDKTGGHWIRVSYLSSRPLTINGNLFVRPGAVFAIYSTFDVMLKGDMNSSGSFYSNHGKVVLNGNNQILKMNTGNYFNNLAFNQSETVTIDNSLSDILDVKGNVEIHSGVFSLQDREMHVGGNWNNNVGSDAFSEGTSLVVFNGSGELNHQLINGTTNFYNVSNTKTGGGTLYFMGVTNIANNFIANGVNVIAGPAMSVAGLLDLSTGSLTLSSVAPTVTVNNFTMGGDFSVIDGNFACTDITNDGIYGNIDLSNGIISLNQVGEQYTDLNGNLNISGGTFNVNGTFDLSIWGWSGPASLTMSGGVLNFNTPGIGFVSAHTIATSISGGIIRTTGSFQVSHPNFTPTGGTAELYGNNPVYVQSSGGAHFYNLTIDKPAGSLLGRNLNKEEEQIDAIREQRSQKGRIVCEPPSGRSDNSAYTNGNLKVVNNTVIEAGSLIIEHDASISGDLIVNEDGKLSLLNLGSLAMGDSKALTVNSGGELSLQGNATDFPKITRISGNYGLNIESGAAIAAEHAIFEYMNTAGVNVKPGAHVDPAKSFTNCIFRNGQSGGRLITLNNNQTLLLSNVSFPGSSGNFNISKTVDEGVVVLTDYSGGFAGASWEQDDHNRIHWTGEPSTGIVLDGVAVGSYEDFCFEAIENITVGGSQNFVVEAFGEVNLVAGESILMLPGTHAHSGSYLHAQISDVSFCSGLPLALVAAITEDPGQHNWQEMNEVKTNKGFIKVFPNPARDIITLVLTPPVKDGLVVIEVYNLMGQNLMSKRMEAKPQYQLDFTGLQSGVYLLKLTHGNTPAFTKLIKQ